MTIFRPSVAAISIAGISLCSYVLGLLTLPEALPPGGNLTGTVLIVGWYTLIVVASEIGYRTGRRKAESEAYEGTAKYWMLSLVGFIGAGAVAMTLISAMGVSGIIEVVSSSRANTLKYELNKDYSVGVLSLRYVCILSGALAMRYLFIDSPVFRPRSGQIWLLSVCNLLALTFVALISSRLSLVAALCIALTDSHFKGKLRSINFRNLAILATVLFSALTLFNWTRNSGYYRERYDIENPFLMNFVEIIRYTGYPWGASSIAASALYETPEINANLSNVLLVIARSSDKEEFDVNWFSNYTQHEASLTTNSVFVEVTGYAGIYGLISFLFLVLFWSAIFAWSSAGGGLWPVISGVILYAFMEVFRINLFVTGIFYTLVAVPVVIEILFYFLRKRPSADGTVAL